jgi:hypothetical protein
MPIIILDRFGIPLLMVDIPKENYFMAPSGM